jgi:hypothetical protein
MRTDDLIARLADDLEPVKNGTVARILVGAMVPGVIASVALMLGLLGPRHDLAAAMTSFGMWMKLTYCFALAAFGFWLVERSGRPGATVATPWLMAALPFLAVAALAALELSATGADSRTLMLGNSARVCAVRVLLVSLPALAATFWALKRLAPTRLGLAGAGAGLFAGAAGAFVYAFHCTEAAATFVAIWYTLGILLSVGLGALLGPNLLRW